MNFRRRLLFFTVFLGVALGLAIPGFVAVSLYYAKGAIRENAVHGLHTATSAIAEQAELSFEMLDDAMARAWLASVSTEGRDVGVEGMRLSDIASAVPFLQTIEVWRDDDRLLARGGSTSVSQESTLSLPAPSELLQAPTVDLGDLRVALTAQGNLSAFIRRWPSYGEFAARLVVAKIDVRHFADFFEDLDRERLMTFGLVASGGAAIVAVPSQEAVRALLAGGSESARLLEATRSTGGSPARQTMIDGQLVSYRAVGGLPLVAVASEPTSEIFASWREQLWREGGLAGLSLLLVATITGLLVAWQRRQSGWIAEIQAARLEAERADTEKTAFLAHMSHELRTPLNAIIGFSEILALELFGRRPHPRYAEYAGDIHESGKHLLGLINKLLDLAKIEAGGWDLQEQEVPLAMVVREALRMVVPQAEQRQVALHNELSAEAPVVLGDAQVLRQILVNLLGNAVKCTPAGGRVWIGSKRLGDGRLELFVRDTGCGMSAEDLRRVLIPFAGVASATARRRSDTGLGLPLCKAFAELHDGELTIESTPGEGTTVAVRLPAARLRSGAPVQPALAPGGGAAAALA